MPRRRKAKPTKMRAPALFGDVTINDFANSATANVRTKKPNTNLTCHINQEVAETGQRWDDPAFESYDYVQERDKDGKVSYVLKNVPKLRIKRFRETNTEGIDYPLDIWFLISDYIAPEAVCKFALICKSSNEVVHTAKFWFGLYKRYYMPVKHMPRRLRPQVMCRKFGIRTAVVKALFFMYPPFIRRVESASSRRKHLTKHLRHDLLKSHCVLVSYQKLRGNWVYYFKFKYTQLRNVVHSQCNENCLEFLDDITANTEKDYKILIFTCKTQSSAPVVQGLFLIAVDADFPFENVSLHFHANAFGSQKKGAVVKIDFESVIEIRLLDWWHPLYPHRYNAEIFVGDY